MSKIENRFNFNHNYFFFLETKSKIFKKVLWIYVFTDFSRISQKRTHQVVLSTIKFHLIDNTLNNFCVSSYFLTFDCKSILVLKRFCIISVDNASNISSSYTFSEDFNECFFSHVLRTGVNSKRTDQVTVHVKINV